MAALAKLHIDFRVAESLVVILIEKIWFLKLHGFMLFYIVKTNFGTVVVFGLG